MKRNRKPNRLRNYNYSSDNLYFVTSCVQNRICCFGEIGVGTGRDLSKKQMILNEYGKSAEKQWFWLGEKYPYVVLHSFVVMPNHIHGIIEINRSHIDVVGTGRDLSLPIPLPKIKSLSEIIGAYKTTVSKQIHLCDFTCFSWQRSFYEHIIRNGKSFATISNYITNNPGNWELDRFYIG